MIFIRQTVLTIGIEGEFLGNSLPAKPATALPARTAFRRNRRIRAER
jgi:hypothetical protein